MTSRPDLGEELKKIPAEPLLPIEKKLIGWRPWAPGSCCWCCWQLPEPVPVLTLLRARLRALRRAGPSVGAKAAKEG